MSRIGKLPITIPTDVTVSVSDGTVVVTGAKGSLAVPVPSDISVKQDQNRIFLTSTHEENKNIRALHGTARADLQNAVTGVKSGWNKTLELSGVGYRASMQGDAITLTVGYSHPVTIAPPPGITFSIAEGKIIVSGVNRQQVGLVAAKIREVKKPEPYKGKGIKYIGEKIRKKAGKAAKAIGAAGVGGAAGTRGK